MVTQLSCCLHLPPGELSVWLRGSYTALQSDQTPATPTHLCQKATCKKPRL